MSYKSYILGSLIAVLFCVGSIVLLAKDITDTGQRIHNISLLRIGNFSFQNNRNFDELERALFAYRDCSASPAPAPRVSNREYVERFDVVWSGFKNAYRFGAVQKSAAESPLGDDRLAKVEKLRQSGVAFLDKYESDMAASGSISCGRINEMLTDILAQKEEINEFAQQNYEMDIRATVEQQRDLTLIYRNILFLAFSFLATLLLAAALVYKALKAANDSSRRSDISSQQAMEALAQLRESRDKNVQQKHFFATASHDLRQPLHALGLYIGSLGKHVDSPEAKHILRCANLSTESLSGLLDSLMDLSKLDVGIIRPDNSEFEGASLVRRIHHRFLPEATEKGIQIKCSADNSLVFSDEQLLDRILQNLLSNSLAYTKEGFINIACRTINDKVEISVSDTGIGIPELKQESVFNEFYQLGVQREKGKGLGLGLSIVRRLSKLIDAELDMQSQEGVGTTFTISLPSVNTEPVTASTVCNVVRDFDLAGLKILLVDDDEKVLESTAVLLNSEGCVLEAAGSFQTARLVVQDK